MWMGTVAATGGMVWQYPALCCGKEMKRITRVMVRSLQANGWIKELRDSFEITECGRKALIQREGVK